MNTPSSSAPIAKPEGPFWFINSLVTIVADAARTEASMAIYRQVAPLGFATPYHKHNAYDEGFYVLDGEITVVCDGEKTILGKNGFIFLPGTKPHGFLVSGSGPATIMIVSPPQSTFGDFVREMGEPAPFHALPTPSQPDFKRLAELSAKYGSVILGPLPV